MTRLRAATVVDMEAIRLCHAQTEALLEEIMDLPSVGSAPMAGYVVVERDGKIIGGAYLEKCIEYCQFGTDPEATAVLLQYQRDVMMAATNAGTRFMHVLVPPRLGRRPRLIQKLAAWLLGIIISPHARKVGKMLIKSGFDQTGHTHYSIRLRG